MKSRFEPALGHVMREPCRSETNRGNDEQQDRDSAPPLEEILISEQENSLDRRMHVQEGDGRVPWSRALWSLDADFHLAPLRAGNLLNASDRGINCILDGERDIRWYLRGGGVNDDFDLATAGVIGANLDAG